MHCPQALCSCIDGLASSSHQSITMCRHMHPHHPAHPTIHHPKVPSSSRIRQQQHAARRCEFRTSLRTPRQSTAMPSSTSAVPSSCNITSRQQAPSTSHQGITLLSHRHPHPQGWAPPTLPIPPCSSTTKFHPEAVSDSSHKQQLTVIHTHHCAHHNKNMHCPQALSSGSSPLTPRHRPEMPQAPPPQGSCSSHDPQQEP
jgi:hypothetical protein